MTIVGFNFTKIRVEKTDAIKGKINISNNVSIKEVTETDLSLGTAKQKGIKFSFVFSSSYEPKIGVIELEGDVLSLEEAKKVKEILDSWKKDKQVPKETMTQILNNVLAKCNIEALLLSREVNLPPPIPMPKVSVDDKAQ
ncbi:MAG: hypothetical protein ABIC95_04390 [archaeon]